MSEYQNYQWACVIRHLSFAQRSEISALSSHIRVGANDAEVSYHWGDFKHNPDTVLKSYFDVHTYIANWGSQNIAFRFPADEALKSLLSPFLAEGVVTLRKSDTHLVFDILFDENWSDFDDSYEFENSVSSAAAAEIYREILEGDLRGPYIFWLKACELGHDPIHVDLPIPAGLDQLEPHHRQLLDFILLDKSVISQAAKYSPQLTSRKSQSSLNLAAHVRQLPEKVKTDILEQLINTEPSHAQHQLRAQLLNITKTSTTPDPSGPNIPFEQLSAQAKAAEHAERDRLAAEEAEKRSQYLTELGQREPEIWNLADQLIASKIAKNYEQAVLLLRALEDLHTTLNTTLIFLTKVRTLSASYPRLTGVRRRLREAGWIDQESLNFYEQSRGERWRSTNPLERPIDFNSSPFSQAGDDGTSTTNQDSFNESVRGN